MDVDDRMTRFSDLPSCLIIDILLKLPLTTLLTCRYVCKDWTRLFRDPSFIKLHLAASPIHILNNHLKEEDGRFQVGQITEDKCTGDLALKIVNLRNLNLLHAMNSCAEIYNYVCMNSCNGLLCLLDHYSNGEMSYANKSFARSVCVCNPILGEWVSISTPVRKYNFLSMAIALVFSAKDNRYKVLHGFEAEQDYGFEIYTLDGTRQWRSIDETLGCRPWKGTSYDRDLNIILHGGSLHWIIGSSIQKFICCFDVDNEKFRRLPLPSFGGKSSFTTTSVQLRVINGCLCALCDQPDHEEMWFMKEYGVEESWVMMPTSIRDGIGRHIVPLLLFSLNEEEIVMYGHFEGFVSYDLRRHRLRRSLEKNRNFFYGAAYNPSFVSLQDVAKGEQVML